MSEALSASRSESANLQQVHALVRNREVLRPGFAQVWRGMARRDAAAIAAWADATLELSRVHAGPGGIGAFWKACDRAAPAQFGDVVDAAFNAADICRLAGSRAALACLEAVPVVLRLCRGEADRLAGWWRGLMRLAREAPTLVAVTVGHVETLLSDGDGMGFADFVAAGLKATARDKSQRAAFFALESALAQSLLRRRRGAAGFAESEAMLESFVTGLWGGTPRLQATPLDGSTMARRTSIAEGIVVLPPVFAGVPASQQRDLYRAAVAHAQAHLTVTAVRFPLLQLKPLQMALIGLIEDARVEALAIRHYPGLRTLWGRFHAATPGGANTCVNLMARLARGLLDPDYADANGFVEKGRALFEAASGDLESPALSRRIGGLLGNDLGQLRLQFNAKTYVVEPAYRCDNMHLWALPETPDDAMALTVDAARGSGDDGGGDRQQDDPNAAPRARSAGRDDRGVLLARYPEWDAVAGVERPDWTTLWDTTPRLGLFDAAGDGTLQARVAQSVRSTVVGRSARQSPREDGEQLDIDAAINFAIARRSGDWPDPLVYYDRKPTGRDLSTLVVLDVSQSTAAIGPSGQSVLAAQVLAVGALAAALERRGDRYALRAFASAGRDDVRLTRLKDFDERLSPTVLQRLAGLQSGLSTRMGAALRHAGSELGPLRTTRKLVLVLTDGEPSDIDVADPRELVEDARRAALGLRLQGIDVFGIVMDPAGVGSAPTIFGRHSTMAVRRLEELPARLAGVYFRLAQR